MIGTVKNVVWIASFPKSGNTWTHSIIKSAGKRYGFPSSDMDVYNLKATKSLPEICDSVIGYSDCAVLKTHSRYLGNSETHKDLGLNTVGAVHIIRNPMDVLLSFINFSRIQYRTKINHNDKSYAKKLFVDLLGFDEVVAYEKWAKTSLDDIPKKNLDHALNYFSDMDGRIDGVYPMSGTYFDNNLSWSKQDGVSNIVPLRYEDCIENDENFYELSKIFAFSESDISTAIDEIRKRKRDGGDDSIFYNKMTSGYYSSYFSRNTIESFLSKHDQKLVRLGYTDL